MTGGPTSASTGSPLGRRSFNPGTPRFGWFISLLCDAFESPLLPFAVSAPGPQAPSPQRQTRADQGKLNECS